MEKNTNTNNEKSHQRVATKNGAGPLHLVRVAQFMLRRRSTEKSNSVNVDVANSKGLWKRLVGAMRPLHHQQIQHHQSPPPSIAADPTTTTTPTIDSFHDVLPPPDSPSPSYDGMSQYASAQNLQELDRCDVVNKDNGSDGGDEMIDARADEFIAHFYEQMRLQRLESLNRQDEKIKKGSH